MRNHFFLPTSRSQRSMGWDGKGGEAGGGLGEHFVMRTKPSSELTTGRVHYWWGKGS